MADRYRFHFRWITALAAAGGLALTLAAANWQLGRAHEKEALAARLAALAKDAPVAIGQAEARAQDLEWRQVTARGRFVPRLGVLIDNRIRRGVAAGLLSANEADMLVGGFVDAYTLLLTHEVAAARAGSPVSTFIAPADLGPLTRRHLRESFRAIGLIQGRVDRDWTARVR